MDEPDRRTQRHVADRVLMSEAIDLGFVVKGYPGSERRVEDDTDLERAYAPDLLQGAFMGDAILRIDDVDLSTRFGWVSLIDWCVRLSVALTDLRRDGKATIGFAESDDAISLRRHLDVVLLAASYQPGIALAPCRDFEAAVHEFIDARLNWIAREHPEAMRNPAMAGIVERIGWPFRT
jgi:hypothetical protein